MTHTSKHAPGPWHLPFNHGYDESCSCRRCVFIRSERVAAIYEREQRDLSPMTIGHEMGQSCRENVRRGR